MCKRSDPDPLVRYFVDEYHLNLLATPREHAAPGDLYIQDRNGISAPAQVAGFLDPVPTLDIRPRTEVMAGLAGKVSRQVSFSAGLGLLESFLLALGAGGIVDRVRAGYAAERATSVRFRFDRAQRESMDVGVLARALAPSRLDPTHPLVNRGNRYYLVAAVVRTASLAVVAEDEQARRVDLSAGVLTALDAETDVGIRRSDSGEVTYEGARQLAIGVEVYDLSYDEDSGKLRLTNPSGPLALRGASAAHTPTLIGGADGDALISVGGT